MKTKKEKRNLKADFEYQKNPASPEVLKHEMKLKEELIPEFPHFHIFNLSL